jgi:hypothetical protein
MMQDNYFTGLSNGSKRVSFYWNDEKISVGVSFIQTDNDENAKRYRYSVPKARKLWRDLLQDGYQKM